MIAMFLATLALQADPYETVNPTIPYTRCMRKGLSARLSGKAQLDSAKRIAALEQTLAECVAIRASALAKLDIMFSKMAESGGTPPDPRFNGTIMMGVWDKTFRELALDPEVHWHDVPARTPGQ